MPLLWKKAKTTKISRIVADLQSPKRGGSMVVETGFPTSLIDIFVKNRDRLRKPSIKRKKSSNKNRNDEAFEPPHQNETKDAETDNRSAPPAPELEISRETSGEEEKPEKTPSRRGSDVAALAIGILAVAFLALSTKKLAVGVTLSAFALLLAEFVSKIWSRVEESESDEEDEFVANRNSMIQFSGDDDEVVLRPNLDELSRDKKWGALDPKLEKSESESESDRDRLITLEKISKSKSKRAKIRRKIIKNFVPKKLRSASKKRKNKANDINNNKNNLETVIEEESTEIAGEEADELIEIEISVEDDDGEEEEEQEEDEEQQQNQQELRRAKWEFVILIGIVLIGLCWGRIFALVLTILWCFVIKLIGFFRKLWEAYRQVSS